MSTLRELVDQYGANGFILIDDGNGSAGPSWIEWDEEMDEAYGDTEMSAAKASDLAYAGQNDDNTDTLDKVAKYVVRDYSSDEMYASEWIEDDDRNAPYQAQNPYSYRIIF